jgi:hypothetical protein
MRVLQVTNLPIYLPFDKAPVPFGDPINGATATAAAPGVFSVPGYDNPIAGDSVAFSFMAGGSLPAPLIVGTQYFVVSPTVTTSAATFSVSATKGGAAITTTTTGSLFTTHLLSNQVDGVTLPFKPTATVVVENNTAGALSLQSAPDVNVAAPGTSIYNQAPGGPGTFTTIVTVAAGGAAEVVLNNDWIRVSTAATLVLQQN